MAKRDKGSKRVPTDGASAVPANNPFAELLAGKTAPAADPEVIESVAEAEPSTKEAWPAKVVLRREKKGRGGKTVTLIEGLETFTEQRLEDLARDLRKALGVGATLEGSVVVLQGDVRDRLEPLLLERGARKIKHSG